MRWGALLLAVVAGAATAPLRAQQTPVAPASGQLPAGIEDLPLGLNGESAKNPGPKHYEVEFLGPSQTTIPAGSAATVELRFRIAEGLHINSHTPREKTLLPTRLAVLEAEGVRVTAVDFPTGAVYRPAFAPQETFSVYTGDFTLRAHLTARPGEHLLRAALRYQACNVNTCMPPRTLPIEVGILAK